eukprot:gene10120-7216_t
MGNSKSAAKLGERPLEFPLNLSEPVELVMLQANPPRHVGVLEVTGRVYQNDYDKSVVGWVDAHGDVYRNDYNRMKVGRVDLASGLVYQADYNNTLVGRVNEEGFVCLSPQVVHASASDVPIAQVVGGSDAWKFGAAAILLLF